MTRATVEDYAAEIQGDLGPLPSVTRQEAAHIVRCYFGDEPSEVLAAISEALYRAYLDEEGA